ncbi:DgyrCDS14018 [Dimorphilus gyrociliatus]|nr:DgyrCDS14018 [Dimorphilus gyrociliatus]
MSDSKSALTGFEQPRAILKKISRPKHEKNDKYHKIFKRVPADENLIEHFSCAYFGDILLQGCLYISANWFCFYSKILGRVKLIEIPLESVIEITRRRTAFVIPNAIGIRTKQNKYVFGSLLSRDNTFKLMNNVWRLFSANRPIVQPSQGLGEIEDEEDKDNVIETGDNENDSDESSNNSGRRMCHKNRTPSIIFKRQSCCTSEVKIGDRKSVHPISFLTRIWLGICFILVIILSLLAFYQTLKVFDLQTKLELGTGHSYSSMKTDYAVNVHNLREVLKSNVDALKAIGDSIHSITEEQTEESNS